MNKCKEKSLFTIRTVLFEMIVLLLIIITVAVYNKIKVENKDYSKKDPYIIASTEDFVDFANMVHDGYSFKGEYVLMINDIDLTDIWVPAMGVPNSGHYFEGVFDGGGHVIYNIFSGVDEGDYSLFGTLAGTVMNLGIESGVIQGDTCGSIASHSFGENARIINCYSKAQLYGKYVGGIAGNFDGKIFNCFSMCELNGIYGQGEIICYGNIETANCFSASEKYRHDTHSKVDYVKYYFDERAHTLFSQFMPEICSALNKGFRILLLECPDIPTEDFYLWSVANDGQTLIFSDNKAELTKIDYFFRVVLYMLRDYAPLSVIIVISFVFINVLLMTGGLGRIYMFDKKGRV